MAARCDLPPFPPLGKGSYEIQPSATKPDKSGTLDSRTTFQTEKLKEFIFSEMIFLETVKKTPGLVLEVCKIDKECQLFERIMYAKEGRSTALHKAVKSGDIDLVNFIVRKYNISVDVRDIKGRTPLFLAVAKKDRNLVLALIELGANVTEVDFEGFNILVDAAWTSDIDFFDWVVNTTGLDPKFLSEINGQGVLLHSARKGNKSFVEHLLKHYKLNPFVIDFCSQTVLHAAADSGNYALFHFLVEEIKLDVTAVAHDGRTILHSAARGGNVLIIAYLIDEKKLNPSAVDLNGHNLFNYAKKNGRNIVDYLTSKYPALKHQ